MNKGEKENMRVIINEGVTGTTKEQLVTLIESLKKKYTGVLSGESESRFLGSVTKLLKAVDDAEFYKSMLDSPDDRKTIEKAFIRIKKYIEMYNERKTINSALAKSIEYLDNEMNGITTA